MAAPLYTRPELLAELDLTDEAFAEWEKFALVRPITGSDGDSLYSTDELEAARRIQALLATGYDLAAVQKIVRKVGLPIARGDRRKNARKQLITVGQLADRTGLNTRTIRYWEERGIIAPDGRSTGGFRLYSDSTVTICRLVKDLQLFGYSLEEIKVASDMLRDFFAFSEGGLSENSEATVLRLDSMLEQINGLEERIKQIRQGIQRWEALFKKRKRELHRLREKMAGASPRKATRKTTG